MTLLRSSFALACLVAAAAPSQASVTVFYDEASYLAAVGSTIRYSDFAGSPAAEVAGSTFVPGVVFGSCPMPSSPSGCTTTVFHNSDGITDTANGTAANRVGSVAWRFDLPDVHAFAFHYVSGAIEALNFVDSATLTLDTVGTAGASGFIGVLSTTAVFGVIAVNGSFPGIGLDRYFIDDFRINATAAVPVPATAALVALGLVGLVSLRRPKA